jgi:phosphoribosylcarboxyaminoimidazole (NCAIR) mutase
METDQQTAAPSAVQRPRGVRAQLIVFAVGAGIALVLAGFVAGRQTAPAAPVAVPTQKAKTSGVVRGPTDIGRGVPLGYTRSKEGAVAAAVNFASLLNSQRLVDRDTYLKAVRAITAPESVDAQVKKAGDYLDGLESSRHLLAKAQLGFSVAIRYLPAGYQLVSFDDDKATVKVWGSTVLGLEQEPLPVEAWGTTTFQLRWVGDDWRMVDQKAEATTTVPKTVQAATPTTSGLTPELGGFEQALLYAVGARS